MKIVVVGGTGLVGCRLVANLVDRGHEVVAASPSRGVDSITGAGLADALVQAQVVVDVSNAPFFTDDEVLDFFRTSASNIAAAAKQAGVRHLVALSIVGADRLQTSGYFRGKRVQECVYAQCGLPFTLVRATQFFEFLGTIAYSHIRDGVARLPSFAMRPAAASDVAAALAEVALSAPANAMIEVAGPEQAPAIDFVGEWLRRHHASCAIVPDPAAGYFGAPADDRTLVPSAGARTLPTRFDVWLAAAQLARTDV